MATKNHIALFGGSFDPVHLGHVGVCEYLLKRTGCRRVLLVPCFQHPLTRDLAPFADRMAMCRLAVGRFGDRVEVSEIERTLGGVSYTVRTLQALRRRHPAVQWHLAVGSDAVADFDSWQDAAWIRAHATLVAIPRGPASPIPDVSATRIRSTLAAGGAIAAWVPPAVDNYIRAQQLYSVH